MIIRSFLLLIFTQFLYAQDPVITMLDSLAQANSEGEKARLSMVIASQLAEEDWKRSLHYIDFAQKSAKKTKSDSIIADINLAVGSIYSQKEAYDISLEHFLNAYEYYQHKPILERFELESYLAINYSQTENLEKALELFQKIADYVHIKEDPLKLATTYNNIALVWMVTDLDSALVYYNKSLHLVQEMDKPGMKAFLYTNLARCANLKEDEMLAKRFFNLAIKESKKAGSGNLPWIYGQFSEFYLKIKSLDSAIYYSKNAVKMWDSIAPYSTGQLKATKVLYSSYIKKGEFEKASHFFEKFMAISDSLSIEDRRINVQKIVLDEEYRTKDQIRELEESKSRANFYSLILGLTVLLLILGTFLYHFRDRLKRTELEKQLVTFKQKELVSNLELKNKELIGKAMIEMHRAEIIEEVLNDLKEIKLKAEKKETQNAIDYIAKRLKRDTSSNVWDEFELRFEQVHEAFYKNLIKGHPHLSPKDKRLCALLKLNLTSKEISQITGQTAKTVENARTRLRKKLKITNSQTDLSAYLSKFG